MRSSFLIILLALSSGCFGGARFGVRVNVPFVAVRANARGGILGSSFATPHEQVAVAQTPSTAELPPAYPQVEIVESESLTSASPVSVSGSESGSESESGSGSGSGSESGSVTASVSAPSLTGTGTTFGALARQGITVDGNLLALAQLRGMSIGAAAADDIVVADSSLRVSASLAHEALPYAGGATNVVVHVEGPRVVGEANANLPLRITLVVDRSESMRNKWADVVVAVRELLGTLRADDEIQVIAFGDNAEEIVPVTRVRDARGVVRAILNTRMRGGTNFEAGLRFAYGLSAPADVRNSIVVVVSDGVPNGGLSEASELGVLAADARARVGCRTTTVGIGSEFDADILQGVASQGAGHFYVSENTADLGASLAAEVSLRARTVARNVNVRVNLAQGVAAASRSDEFAVQADGSVLIALPSLAAGESRNIVIPVMVAAGRAEAPVATVQLGWLAGQAGTAQRYATKSLSVDFAREARLAGELATRHADLNAALSAKLNVAAVAVENGDGAAAAAALNEYCAYAHAHAETSVEFRSQIATVAALANAVSIMLPSASWSDRRVVSRAMVQLSFNIGL